MRPAGQPPPNAPNRSTQNPLNEEGRGGGCQGPKRLMNRLGDAGAVGMPPLAGAQAVSKQRRLQASAIPGDCPHLGLSQH
eukprot:5676127-Heterocapsa_arctica.AAC.1